MIKSLLIICICVLFIYLIKQVIKIYKTPKKIKGILKKKKNTEKNIEKNTEKNTEKFQNQEFFKAETYEGSKDGFYFGTGTYGTGYYLDKNK